MWMEEIEIERLYKSAADPIKELIVLAECNAVTAETIVNILHKRSALKREDLKLFLDKAKKRTSNTRPRTVWTDENLFELRERLQKGQRVCEISAEMGVSTCGLYAIIHKRGLKARG